MAEFKLRIIHDRRNCIKKGIRDVAPVEIEVGMVGVSHKTFVSANVTLSKRNFKCGSPLKLQKTSLSKIQESMISDTYSKVLKFTNSSS